MKHSLFTVILILLFVWPVSAQNPSDPASKARVKLGPLSMNPVISLTNMGIDTNVFNDPADVVPKRDFTLTVSPTTDFWLRMGRTWVTGKIAEEIVWYQKYASERAANNTYKIGWFVPLNRMTFNVNSTWLSARERPGFEIDTRADRKEPRLDGGVEVNWFSKTYIGLQASRQQTRFAAAAVYRDINLNEALSRTSTTVSIGVRHKLTPLTDLSFTVGRNEDRFAIGTLRNSTSMQYAFSVNFDPAALLKGGVSVGYRDFRPASPDMPRYKGVTTAINLGYVLLGATKFSVQINRDLQYSYDVNQPTYLQTGFGGSVSQQIYGPVDVVVRAARQRLEYSDREGVDVQVRNRVDEVQSFGGGMGYRIGKDVRIGFNIDKQTRDSKLDFKRYKGLRYGMAVTYGL